MSANRFDFRVDQEMRLAVEKYATEKGLTISAAVRILLSIALRDGLSVNDAAHTQAIREGVLAGQSQFKERIGAAVNQALSDLGA